MTVGVASTTHPFLFKTLKTGGGLGIKL
jgi:hypothetical protein